MPKGNNKRSKSEFNDKEKPSQIRGSNIVAAKAIADVVRTSLGPRGMDKMIQDSKGEVTITNDGATILKQMKVLHPAAISDSLGHFATKAVEILQSIAIPVDLSDKSSLLKSANTSLSSKVVHEHSVMLAPMAVDAVLKIVDPNKDTNVDLKDIRIIKKLGETVEDSQLVDGIVFTQKTQGFGGPNKVDKAKVALIQFCISTPKTDMDRVLREERQYILNITKKIKAAGCNVLLIQKS